MHPIDRSTVSLFLSHSTRDKSIVRAIGTQLELLGYRVWIDETQLVLGDRIQPSLERAVERSNFLILFLSPNSVTSRWVDEEWRTKFEEQVLAGRTLVIPVVLEPCEIPASLRGRLALGPQSANDLLIRGHLEIDRAVTSHLSRVSGTSSSASPEFASRIANVRKEVFDSVVQASGSLSRANLAHLYDLLMSQLTSAASMYDMGHRKTALQLYREMVVAMSAPRFLWSRSEPLARTGEKVLREIEQVLRQGAHADVWAFRMVLDHVIEHVHAAMLLHHVQERLPGWGKEPQMMPLWYPFDILSYAMERRQGHEFKSMPILFALCESAIHTVRPRLERIVDPGGLIDLHEASILRILRWPGLSGRYDGTYHVDQGEVVRNPVQLLWDIQAMEMSRVHQHLYVAGLSWPELVESVLSNGAVETFDRALAQRGYERDADYWSDPSRFVTVEV